MVIRAASLRAAALFFAFAVFAQGKESWDHPPRRPPAGIEHHTFQSASMQTRVGYNVALPPGYGREGKKRFPVIYYLHGFEGHESSYLKYAEHWREALPRLGPCLLVFVNGGGTSMFCDSADGEILGETVVIKELLPEVDGRFRTVAEPRGRALHGYSMGGFGALKLLFKRPDLFGSAVAYGATLSTVEEMQQHAGKLYAGVFGTRENFARNDPLSILEKSSDQLRGRIKVEMLIGSKDEFLPGNKRLSERLTALRIDHRFVELPGVKHDKEDLFDQAAANAFAFTADAFGRKMPVQH